MPTYTELMRGFEFGPWEVIPERGLVRDGETRVHIEPLVMDVFVVLASHGGEVVTKDQLIEAVWDGRPQTDDVITRCISALRKALGDSAREPRYIETVQRRGYRIMMPVAETAAESEAPAAPPASPIRADLLMIATGFIAVIIIGYFALVGPIVEPPRDSLPASVAVYPFDCLQEAGGSDGHLCFGFAEEVISSLKQVEGMQIIRKRVAFGDSPGPVEESIVTGSVQIIGDQVRISAQLENAETGVVIWSHSFDAEKDGIFSMQREVAGDLRAVVDDDFEVPSGLRAGPSSYAAAEAYALGRFLFEKRDHGSIVEAIGHFEEAIRLDPSYGPAWLGLASIYSIWPDYDLSIDRSETFDRALEIVAEGVRADPSISDAAGTVRGYVYLKRYQWHEAMESTRAAVNADTADGDDHNWHSRVLASVGRLDESLHYARLAAELDPDYPALMSRLAMASFWVDDLENAERYFNIANQMEFSASVHALAYALYLIRDGDIEAAKASTRNALEELDLDTSWVGPLFDGFVDPSQREQAIALLDQLQATGQMPANVIMSAAVLLGDADRAMAVARGPEIERDAFDIEIIYIDQFRAFRQHPDFEAFTQEVGLANYWRDAGCSWVDDRISCPAP